MIIASWLCVSIASGVYIIQWRYYTLLIAGVSPYKMVCVRSLYLKNSFQNQRWTPRTPRIQTSNAYRTRNNDNLIKQTTLEVSTRSPTPSPIIIFRLFKLLKTTTFWPYACKDCRISQCRNNMESSRVDRAHQSTDHTRVRFPAGPWVMFSNDLHLQVLLLFLSQHILIIVPSVFIIERLQGCHTVGGNEKNTWVCVARHSL